MTAVPIFAAAATPFGAMLDDTYSLAGSGLLVSPTLALTCEHVVRAYASEPANDRGVIPSLVVGTARCPVRQVRCAELEADDLALLVLERPQPYTPIVFARQWQIDSVHAYGFTRPPFTSPQPDGPIALERRSMTAGIPRYIATVGGVPAGFSGGPVVGRFDGTSYCVALSSIGQVERARSVFITAAACVEFVNAQIPSTCQIENLGPRALALFLERQRAHLSLNAGSNGRGGSFVLSSQGIRATNAPLWACDQSNPTALAQLARGQTPSTVAVTVDARALGTFLDADTQGDAIATTCGFLDVQRPRLAIADTLVECLLAGSVTFVVTHYEPPRPRQGRHPVSDFLGAMQRLLNAGRERGASRH